MAEKNQKYILQLNCENVGWFYKNTLTRIETSKDKGYLEYIAHREIINRDFAFDDCTIDISPISPCFSSGHINID